MASAIGSVPTYNPTPTNGATTSGAEAKIARYKKELSDCVNCESAKTSSGQAKIQVIASKIAAEQARIEKIANDNSSTQTSELSITKADSALSKADAETLTADRENTYDSTTLSTYTGSTIGGLVDVFA